MEERIGALDGQREQLNQKQGEIDQAYQRYMDYTVEDEAQRPADWTEELMWEYEEAYYDLENEVQQLQRQVDEVSALKSERDEIARQEQETRNSEYQDKADRWPELTSQYFDAKAELEQSKFQTWRSEEELQHIRENFDHLYNEFENYFWEIVHFRSEQAREKAVSEDMNEVYADRTKKEEDFTEMMKTWKDPLDDQKELLKNYQDAVERLTGEKAEAKAALDTAREERDADPNNQEKIDTFNAAEQTYNQKDGHLTEAQQGVDTEEPKV